MTTETILLNGVKTDIEVKPITLLFHPGTEKIDVPGRFEINPQTTLEAVQELPHEAWLSARAEKGFVRLFKMVFFDMDPPEFIRTEGLGVRHVVGLIILIKLAEWHKVPVFIRLPESYLHPRYQLGLGDLLVSLTK